jgi:hypothetical protein
VNDSSLVQPDDPGFFLALAGDGRPLVSFTGLALVLSGVFALFLSATGHFLPHDEQFLGMTARQLCSLHGCRIVHFMYHDRASFGGSIIAIGTLYLWLSLFPLRSGEAWAWWTLLLSGAAGFASFLAYLGYGYLDTWHGAATLALLPCFAGGMILSYRTVVHSPRHARTLLRPGVTGVRWKSPYGIGRLCLLATALVLVAAGTTILTVGMTRVFVPTDLTFMGVQPADLRAINPRLIPLIAHDRAGFGGGLCSAGITVFFCIWCGRPSRSLWQALAVSGTFGFVTAIAVHPLIGYNDATHVGPAVAGALVFFLGLALTYGPMTRGTGGGVRATTAPAGKLPAAATVAALFLFDVPVASASVPPPTFQQRVRVIIETDAGGDPDDKQSLVRFLLYANEWDVEGIIATRAKARDGENLNPQRTGLGIVRAMLDAYGQCQPNLVKHDERFPTKQYLWDRTVAGYKDETHDGDDGVRLILAAVDKPGDGRPVWLCNWGTIDGSAESSLKRALDKVLRERGRGGYISFKNRLRLSSDDQFGDHTSKVEPPWRVWVDTFRPEVDRKRWYHQFSAITAKAGGFDVERHVRTGHGPLGALYPLNTTHPQKEGDSMTFLYLVPTGMNDPDHPTWGSWAGRYGVRDGNTPTYYWANVQDAWNGTTSRENTLARWAVHLQNDFRARLDWCVKDRDHANHPPVPVLRSWSNFMEVNPGDVVRLHAAGSVDPDGDGLSFEWVYYPEAGTYRGDGVRVVDGHTASAHFTAPQVKSPERLHFILIVTDDGDPPLTRYQQVIVTVRP